jgi:kynurenine formamidase
VTADDLDFTKKELAIVQRHRNLLLIRTGFGKCWGNVEKYIGSEKNYAYPGIGSDAAQKIVDLKLFSADGLDSILLDPVPFYSIDASANVH